MSYQCLAGLLFLRTLRDAVRSSLPLPGLYHVLEASDTGSRLILTTTFRDAIITFLQVKKQLQKDKDQLLPKATQLIDCRATAGALVI
jgi:hypothetical protein